MGCGVVACFCYLAQGFDFLVHLLSEEIFFMIAKMSSHANNAFALLVILSGGLLTFALVTATADLEALAFPGPV